MKSQRAGTVQVKSTLNCGGEKWNEMNSTGNQWKLRSCMKVVLSALSHENTS
uniref:Uncharacterized protein n=1 Tax=Anguilla anguilla TaxID=7936 RepID=A0A0E9XMM4_ANGAN